jgi:hypothetical protein
MAKRFIDTGFLDQKWIRKLSPERKIFLIYLMLKCDNGGIIDLDIEDVEFWIGKKIGTLEFLPENYQIPLNNLGKCFMPKFIEWQYKDLSSQKFIVAQARQILEKHNLINSDFTLILPKSYVNITKTVPDFQEQGKGIGKGIGIGKEKEEKIDFEIFWNLYNKKVGSKDNCKKKWIKLTLGEQTKIIEILPKYKTQFEDIKFQPHPETFLNQRRWENDILVPVKKSIMSKILSYDEILSLSEKNPDIWKSYKSEMREGERKATFVLIE